MEHMKIQCQDINNPECLCNACKGFFERGVGETRDQDSLVDVVFLPKNNSFSNEITNNLYIKEQ